MPQHTNTQDKVHSTSVTRSCHAEMAEDPVPNPILSGLAASSLGMENTLPRPYLSGGSGLSGSTWDPELDPRDPLPLPGP